MPCNCVHLPYPGAISRIVSLGIKEWIRGWITPNHSIAALPQEDDHSSGYFSTTGITEFNPGVTLTSPNTTDDAPMLYNINLAYDPTTRYMYMTRAYAYPFDATAATAGEIPCNGLMAKGLAMLPNRCQLYRMYLGAGFILDTLYTGTWEPLGDWGGEKGYYLNENGAGCRPYGTMDDMTRVQGDVHTLNLVRTHQGLISSPGISLIMALDPVQYRSQNGEFGGASRPYGFRYN